MKLKSFCGLVAVALPSLFAHADILVSDGFAREAEYPVAAGQKSTNGLNDFPRSFTGNAVGFKSEKWKMNGVQPRVWGYGLSFPQAMTDAGFVAKGENSIGLNCFFSDSDDHKHANPRNAYRALSDDRLKIVSGKLYLRTLMYLEKGAAETMVKTSDEIIPADGNGMANSYSVGLSPALPGTASATSDFLTTPGSIGFFFRKDTKENLAIVLRIKTIGDAVVEKKLCDVTPAEDTASGATSLAGLPYIAYAEIDVNAGDEGAEIVRAGAQGIRDYNPADGWKVFDESTGADAFSCDFLSDAVYPKSLYVDGCYQTGTGLALFDEFIVATTENEVIKTMLAPVLEDAALVKADGSYSVSARVTKMSATVAGAVVTAPDGTSEIVPAESAVAKDSLFTVNLDTALKSAETTYFVGAFVEASGYANTNAIGSVYTGALALGEVTEAIEYGLVAGGVEVSRANADPYPLTVNYGLSSTREGAGGGVTWIAPEPVTIPANATSVVLPVVPLRDDNVKADIDVTVTLLDGSYDLPENSAATVPLRNLSVPEGFKTWVAVSDGHASDGANWSPAGMPAAGDKILFDGAFSTASCVWDVAADGAYASWVQAESFEGTVTFQTTYDQRLEISGDCTLSGGTWTHTANGDAQVHRLSATIGGNLTVGAGARVDATGKGYAAGNFPEGSAVGVHGGAVNDLSKVYGDVKEPTDIGSGGSTPGKSGGGAIYVTVTGDAVIDGVLSARPASGLKDEGLGAGGSIYLSAASISGAGTVTVAGFGSQADYPQSGGTGGRIALVTTSDELAFPKTNLQAKGTVGWYGQSNGAGTIFVKTGAQQNGSLIVANEFTDPNWALYWPTKRGVTPIPPGRTWTFDAIEFAQVRKNNGALTDGAGVLCVPAGTTLRVPLSGVSAAAARKAGILYEGGVLDFGSAPYILSGNWVFQADAPYTFDGNVTVTGGASIGGLRFAGSLADNEFAVCDVTVKGDLTIAKDGHASVALAGPVENNASHTCPAHGGQSASQSGNKAYGSVFDPVLPGMFAKENDNKKIGAGGGVLKLTVTEALIVEGAISANGEVFHKSSAAGGSVNIRAKTLSGTGSITATGKPGYIQWDGGYNGVGGRIAVRVTEQDVGTEGVWSNFAAMGCATNQVVRDGKPLDLARNQNTSAGTVYLQGKSDGEGGGTIHVRNRPQYDTSNVATWIPAGSRGDEACAFRKAKLVIGDRAVVAVGAEKLRLASVDVEENSRIDLHGSQLSVSKATVGGARLAPGIYTAATLPEYLADSGEGGELLVNAGGFSITVR